jgi:hypothetical protein
MGHGSTELAEVRYTQMSRKERGKMPVVWLSEVE